MQFNTTYYLWNVSGNNFNLFTQPSGGGTQVIPSTSGSITPIRDLYLAPVNPPAASTGSQPVDGPGDAESYVANCDGSWSWMAAGFNAIGDSTSLSNMTIVTADSRTRRNASSAYTNVDAIPKYAMQTSF